MQCLKAKNQMKMLGAIEELMWEPRVTADMVVESIKRSAARTQIIINHIDGMINVYQDMCEKSKIVK